MTGKSGTGVSPVSYSYDAARNLKSCAYGSGRTNFYYYEHARRLVKETHTCTGVVQESSSFVYDGLDIVAKVDNLSGDMIYFSRGLGIAPGVGDVLAESHIASNGSLKCTYLYVQNHRGDTIALVSNSTVVARLEYSAWGAINYQLSTTNSATPFFTFSGKHYDSDAGLYYYGYRWYDPQAKRWTQPDPEGLKEGLDLYRFCNNDPINKVDVYGGFSLHNMLSDVREFRNDMKELLELKTGYGWLDTTVNTVVGTAIDIQTGGLAANYALNLMDRVDGMNLCPNVANWQASLQYGEAALFSFFDLWARPIRESGSPVGAPGFAEGLIPFWGSGRSALNDFQTGHWGWGTVNSAFFVSDIFLIRSAATGLTKGGFKMSGSYSWSAMSKWMTRTGWREFKGQELHHWFFKQSGPVPNIIKNQPLNIMPMPSRAFHESLHGWGEMGDIARLYYGNPGWFKALFISYGGRTAEDISR